MNHNYSNRVIAQMIFALFYMLIVGAAQIVIATSNRLHAVMVAHGWGPK